MNDDPLAASLGAFPDLSRYVCPPPVFVVISGPSGVGKDSVILRMRELGHPLSFVVTVTDRHPRANETHGVDYYFVTTAEFKRMVAEDELFEHALVYDQYKGVPKVHVRRALESGEDVVMRLDVQGAATIKRAVPQAVTIFLAPPSPEVLLDRLRRRASDSPGQLARRLDNALGEMARVSEFDYVVVNREDELDETSRQIMAIIGASRLRANRTPIEL